MKKYVKPRKSDHQVINHLIIQFFSSNQNTVFEGYTLREFISSRLNKYIYPEAIYRDMHQLKLDGKINYTMLNPREESQFQILPL